MWIIFIMFAFIAGMILPFQVSINAQLRNFVGSPYLASLISFAVGVITLIVICLFNGGFHVQRSLSEVPWWAWLGGVLGAVYVSATVVLMPRLGAGTMVAFVLIGQIIASIAIDHFGWFQVSEHAVSFPRILGTLLIIGGVILVQKF